MIVCLFLTTQSFSQWTEVALPSMSPQKNFVISKGTYFTYQSPGGVFSSTDQGRSWTRCINGFPSTYELRDLFSFNDRLFVSTFDDGVYMSKDFGESWETLTGLPKDAYENFTVHNDRLFTISRNGFIYMSEDVGAHWTQIRGPEAWNNTGEHRRVFSNGQNLLFAIGEGHLYKSNNNGESWLQVNFGKAFHTPGLIYDIAIHNNAIWIAAVDQNYASILLHSLDHGENWDVLNVGGRFHVESVAASDLFVAYMLSGSIHYSTDNGNSWSSSYVSEGGKIVHHTSEEFLVSSPREEKLFNASNGTISDFKSTGLKGYDISNVELTENELVVFSNNLLRTLSTDLFTINKVSEALTDIP